MQFAIPNADPVATLTFEDVVTVDISTLAETDYISLSLPEFAKTKFNLASTFIDFTSNEKGNFGAGPTDSLKFSEGTFVNTQTNNDTELRFPMSLLKTVDRTAVSGVRFRLLATETTTFRCLAIRACASTWKYAPIDLNTLWHRVDRPPTPNGSASALRTNLFRNPSAETNTTDWGVGAVSWAESNITRSASGEIPFGRGEWAIHATAKKDATTTGRTFSLVLTTAVGTVAAGKTYSVAAPVYIIDNLAQGLAIRFDWYDSSSTYLSSSTPSTPTFTGIGLTTLKTTAVAPTNASRVTVVVFGNSIISGETVDLWGDTWLLEQASETGSYFDGGYAGAEWTGTANASTSVLYSNFPTAEGETFPILFRSNRLTGLSDPEPVNLTVGTLFTTGSLTNAAGAKKNELALVFRDIPTDNQTMIEMDTKNMGTLDSADKQPDYGRALFNARVQEEIDLLDQEELDGRTQFNIERKRDESEHTWMEARLKWGEETSTNKFEFRDADGYGYSWSGMALEKSVAAELDKGKYLLIVTIKGTRMEAKIYQCNQIGQVTSQTPVFETGKVMDDNLMKRRKGRFGWFANLRDGDAHIDNIKTRGANYGEMISKPYRSITPVKGAQIFSGSTADHELITGFERTQPEYMSLTLDPAASATGKAIRVDTSPLKPLQGISTNTFLIDDPSNIRISFDIRFPNSEIAGGGLIGFILGANEVAYPINLSGFTYDVWSHVRVNLPEEVYQTGGYKLVLMQTLPVAATSWWVENLSAKTYSVKWSARPEQPDPWGIETVEWVEAGNTLNEANGGIVFAGTGSNLQVRAQALRQDAEISEFKVVPQYATLGNTIFKKGS